MNNQPQTVEELSRLIKSEVRFDLNLAVDHLTKSPGSLRYQDVKDSVDKAVMVLVSEMLGRASQSSDEQNFVPKAFYELEQRLNLPRLQASKYVETVLRKDFQSHFVSHLTLSIKENVDIQQKLFVDESIDAFSKRFSLTPQAMHTLNLRSFTNRYFPSADFHSDNARFAREYRHIEEFMDSQSYLENILRRGEFQIKYTPTGKFCSGDIAENAWVEVVKQYFGEAFHICQNVPIRTAQGTLPKFDIVIIKKSSSSEMASVVMLEDVVAAFEVKRTLRKHHVKLNSKQAAEIFENRCVALKKATMPSSRNADNTLTPYQALRGKVFFGVLCLDIEKDVESVLLSDDSHPDNWHKQRIEHRHSDYAADIILCPGKLLWAKETRLLGSTFNKVHVSHFLDSGLNCIDESVSSFGYLIATMWRFFTGQGYIDSVEAEGINKKYHHFSLLPSENSKHKRVIISLRSQELPQKLNELDTYLSTRVPNEHSNEYLAARRPLQHLKQWSSVASQDIYNSVKIELKRIVKLEKNLNYQPLPSGVDVNDDSFDDYVSSLYSR